MTHVRMNYDAIGDVLYVSSREYSYPNRFIRNGIYARCTEEIAGFICRYDKNTNESIGVTVLDLKHYWIPKRVELVKRLARFFEVTHDSIECKINKIETES